MERSYDHSEFRGRIDAYLAGGLDAAERETFEAHAAGCPACAAALADATSQDASLRGLFVDARPPEDLEDRVVDRLWSARPSRVMPLHPVVRRAAVGVAAAIMLGGFGYVASRAVESGGLPVPWKTDGGGGARTSVALHELGGEVIQDARITSTAVAGKDVEEAVNRIQSPAEMAGKFNHALAYGESNAQRWDYRGRFGEAADRQWYDRSGRKPGEATNGPAAEPANAAGAPREEKALKQVADATANRALGRAEDFVQGAPKDFYKYGAVLEGGTGVGTGGGGGMGGAPAGAGGFGTSGNAADQPARSAAPAGGNGRAEVVAGDGVDKRLGVEVRSKVQLYDGHADVKELLPTGAQAEGVAGAQAFKPGAHFNDRASDFGRATDLAAETSDTDHDAPANASAPADAQPGEVPVLALKVRATGDAAQPAPGPAQPASGGEAAAPVKPAPAANPDPTAGRKIIRNGEMAFEVDGFDSASMQIVKIAGEEGGFVATTDSEKLANGKVKGTVTVRVPPDRLDTLVLKLRGLGDLKSSRLAAQDITKQYTDIESQLRASRAMEERLLNIIKTGKGEIKDLVEAEKQLGVYREKIETLEGEVRYYNNLVSLSTLNVTLVERDIRTAALLSETEHVNMGVEAQDVETARAAAIKAIEEAKGRIVESDLKKLQAGQFAAKVVADVPPDAAGPLIDRMKQIGVVARLEVERKQSAPEGTVARVPAPGAAGPRVERRDTRFLISLYNLANVAPRQTTSLNLAAEDVEKAYRAVLEQVRGAGGRIVTSQLNRPRPDQTTGTITFEAPAEGADVLLGAVRGAGEVMRLEVTQNPDAQNVTEAKRGFAVQVFSLASVAPRETTNLRVAARGVPDSFNRLREAVRSAAGSRILSSQLAEQDAASVTGTLDFEVRRDDWAAVEAALREAGHVVSRNVSRSADAENTVDSKIRLQVALVDEAAIPPRESVALQLAVADVPGRYGKLLEALASAQARVLQSQLSEQEAQGNVTGTLVFDVRRENRPAVDQALAQAGDVVSRTVTRSTDVQNTLDDKVRLSLSITDAGKLPPRETTTLGMESRDVEKSKEQIESLALALGGRVVDSTLSRETNGRVMAKVVADVPLDKAVEMVRRTRDQGRVQFRRDARDESVPQGTLARARVDVTLANEELIVESGQGLGARIREGLRTSVTGLLWSVQLIVVGLFLVAPWALILYFAWKVVRRNRSRRIAAPAPA